jgi:DNA polymerase-3 subunit epsilon
MFFLIILSIVIIYFIVKNNNRKEIKKNQQTLNSKHQRNLKSHSKSNNIQYNKEILAKKDRGPLIDIPESVNKKNSKELIFFDVETNGLKQSDSVLSIAAFKVVVDFNLEKIHIKDKYIRYYYPIEPYNTEAINVNNLIKEFVDNKRNGYNYSRHFRDDLKSFHEFICDVEHFVAHNIKFDRQFIGENLKYQFCTMLTNTSIVKSKRFRSGKYKWPKLCETASYYNIFIEDSKLHDSYYDVELTVEVFKNMCTHHIAKDYVYNFINSDVDYVLEI